MPFLGGDEKVDLVGEDDSTVGASTVGECLALGLLHRAVAVVVTRSDGKTVLQKRGMTDRWQPGMWTLSSTGHVREGESYERAARRELLEELGIHAEPVLVGKYLLPPITDGSATEREWVALFSALSDAPVRIDPGELAAAKDFPPSALEEKLARGDMTPDSMMLLSEFLRARDHPRKAR